jgi:hypothetical protein
MLITEPYTIYWYQNFILYFAFYQQEMWLVWGFDEMAL